MVKKFMKPKDKLELNAFARIPEMLANIIEKINISVEDPELDKAHKKLLKRLRNISKEMVAKPGNEEQWSEDQIKKILSLPRPEVDPNNVLAPFLKVNKK